MHILKKNLVCIVEFNKSWVSLMEVGKYKKFSIYHHPKKEGQIERLF